MKIIVSPAKKMNVNSDLISHSGLPKFLDRTERLAEWLRSLTYQELKELWKCSDSIARQNFRRLQEMNLRGQLTPAVLSYEGIQYQYMAPAVFAEEELAYIQEHLRILSGFYGVLRPMDGVVPYRLEMQAQVRMEGYRDLYEFWGSSLYREAAGEDHVIVNLASREYAKCVERYLTEKDRMVTCVFAEKTEGKLRQKATFAKMARGEMVRYLAQRQAGRPEDLREFEGLGYRYSQADSTEETYVFLKENRDGLL